MLKEVLVNLSTPLTIPQMTTAGGIGTDRKGAAHTGLPETDMTTTAQNLLTTKLPTGTQQVAGRLTYTVDRLVEIDLESFTKKSSQEDLRQSLRIENMVQTDNHNDA